MKSRILLTALALASLSGGLFAREATSIKRTKTQNTFNANEDDINNRHVVHLKNGNLMIVELADVTDYEMIANLDSLMMLMLKDITPFKDSVSTLENVRFDYVLTKESENTLIRFKKYIPDGSIFVKKQGELAHLKLEQDTLRLMMKKPLIERDGHSHFYDYPVQVTFVLNNYTDIVQLLSDKGLLNIYVQDLAKATLPKTYDPNIKDHPTSIDYYPYSHFEKLVRNEVKPTKEKR